MKISVIYLSCCLLLALRVASVIIVLHNQIALWESDDFVSAGDNSEYDDQLNHA